VRDDTAGSWKLRPSVGRNRLGRLGAAPVRGLCKRSPQRPVAGRFVRLPPTDDGRGRRGGGPRHGRQLKTAAFGGETAGGGSHQPPSGGFANEARNFQLPGVLCDFHPRMMSAAEGRWPRIRPAVENCGLHLRNRLRRLIAAPARGLCKRSPQRPVAGRFVRFHPRTMAAAKGVGRRHGRQSKTAAFTCETARGGSSQPPARGLGK